MNEMKANHHQVVDPHVEKRKKTEISVFPQNVFFRPVTLPFVPYNIIKIIIIDSSATTTTTTTT